MSFANGMGSAAAPCAVDPVRPERLVREDRDRDGRYPWWIAAAVVPAPPWWTTAATRGSSQSCGASPMLRMSSRPSAAAEPRPARPGGCLGTPDRPEGGHRDVGQAFRVAGAGRHAPEPHQHRRVPGGQEVEQLREAASTLGPVRPTSTRRHRALVASRPGRGTRCRLNPYRTGHRDSARSWRSRR